MKIRLQILVAMVILGVVAILGLLNGMPEISTGCTAGVIALGMKLLEGE